MDENHTYTEVQKEANTGHTKSRNIVFKEGGVKLYTGPLVEVAVPYPQSEVGGRFEP